MKRTKKINLERMRKSSPSYVLKPLSVAVAALALVACGSSREAKIYPSVSACTDANPSLASQCDAAYQRALAESQKSGPKFSSQSDCETDFGSANCVAYQPSSGQSWFMPALGGFMFARALDRNYYYGSPMYTSYSRYSPFYGQWAGVDGTTYGSRSKSSVSVKESAFTSKPAVSKTMSRGGFGSSVSAKSNFGGSTTRSSWGG